jgi:hypothetical protein
LFRFAGINGLLLARFPLFRVHETNLLPTAQSGIIPRTRNN